MQQAAASSGRPESPDVHAACSPCPWVKEESGDESGDCTGEIAGSAGTPLGVGWASLSRSCRCVTRTLSHTMTAKQMTSTQISITALAAVTLPLHRNTMLKMSSKRQVKSASIALVVRQRPRCHHMKRTPAQWSIPVWWTST